MIGLSGNMKIEDPALQIMAMKSESIEEVIHRPDNQNFEDDLVKLAENYQNLKKLTLNLATTKEEYELKAVDYEQLERLTLYSLSTIESLWSLEVVRCGNLKYLDFTKIHSLELKFGMACSALEELKMSVCRKLVISSENPEFRVKSLKLEFFHGRNFEFLQYVERADIAFNFMMI